MASASFPKPPPIRACLFDMDGLLIDSEDIYTKVTNHVLHEFGRPDLPWKIKAQLQGRPYPQATAIFAEWAKLPISQEEYSARIAVLQRQQFPECKPLPGVLDLLSTLTAPTTTTSSTSTPVRIAMATSSNSVNFGIKTNHLPGLVSHFPPESIVKGDDPRIPHGRGKPAPDIYLVALETINKRIRESQSDEPEITPAECLVFEDSVPGVEAGRRAGMQAIWVPHEGLLQEYRGREEEVLAGLTGEHKEEAADQSDAQPGNGPRKHAPGQLGDGWGRLALSLEGFPYAEYGIKTGGQ